VPGESGLVTVKFEAAVSFGASQISVPRSGSLAILTT
jgi:hypothetical protein